MIRNNPSRKRTIEDYADIIDLPHHVSRNHPQLPAEKRAAQFAPFSALTGYSEAIEEANRENEAEAEDTGNGHCKMEY